MDLNMLSHIKILYLFPWYSRRPENMGHLDSSHEETFIV